MVRGSERCDRLDRESYGPAQGISSLTGANIILQNVRVKCLTNREIHLVGEEKHPRTRGVENSQREDAGRQPHTLNSKQLPPGRMRANRIREGWADDPRGWTKRKIVLVCSPVSAITIGILNGRHRSLVQTDV
jgi:hypothetical protein